MKWVRMVLGDNADLSNICFVKVTLDDIETAKNAGKDCEAQTLPEMARLESVLSMIQD